jgi:hypothetical protein
MRHRRLLTRLFLHSATTTSEKGLQPIRNYGGPPTVPGDHIIHLQHEGESIPLGRCTTRNTTIT